MARARRACAGILVMLAFVLAWSPVPALGQEVVESSADLADRPIAEVRIEGGAISDDQLIRNNIRVAEGDPYDAAVVRADVGRIHQLGRFRFVIAEVTLLDDGTVQVSYRVTPQPIIRLVQTSGNRAVSDQELRAIIRLAPGGPRDDYLVQKAIRDIEALYRRRGFYLTAVTVDESELESRGVLLFRVLEGPRVRVKVVEFEGAAAFPTRRIAAELKTRAHVPFIRKGILDEDVLAEDDAALDRFYRDRGYLDVRVGHRIDLSPDSREAKVVFLVSEGERFTLGRVQTSGVGLGAAGPLQVFSNEQVAAMLAIRPGDVYSQEKLERSLRLIRDAYGSLGYLGVQVVATPIRRSDRAEVDLLLEIDEGEPYLVGLVTITGNFLTRDKVIRREVRLKSGRPFDSREVGNPQRNEPGEAEQRLRRTRLFSDVRVTVQDADPDEPAYRDVLVEIKERNTGAVNFGMAVGSDSGVFGEFSMTQSNFDIADPPESFGELVTGRAFRGAGQRFSMVFRPGNEIFQYSVSLTEPNLLESDYALTVSGRFNSRVFSDYDEQRLTFSTGLSRKLGDVWDLGMTARFERVELDDIDLDAPTEVYRDAGPDTLAGVRFSLTRTTIDTFTRPGRGSRLEFSLEPVGQLGVGDLDFWKSEAELTTYITVDEDFFGRKTTVKFTGRVGHIFSGRAPTYERFYLGGRSFRGFDFRTVSPKGIRNDTGEVGEDPVGGDWLLFFGTQYEVPLFEETVTGVLFVDSGTVVDDVGFDDYRVSVGAGVRLYIPAFGPVPIAFDFGFPIVEEDGDESQVLSFSAELPF